MATAPQASDYPAADQAYDQAVAAYQANPTHQNYAALIWTQQNLLSQAGVGAPPPASTPAPAPAPTPAAPTPAPAPAPAPTAPTLSYDTASEIIGSALQIVGLNPNQVEQMPDGKNESLVDYYWNLITSQGITDAGTISDLVSSTITSTPQFQQAFPGYQAAVQKGYIKTPADYVSAEESDTAVLTHYGIPQTLINPTTVGNLISGGVSPSELTDRLENGFAAVQSAPVEVQHAFDQWFGTNSQAALATLFLTPTDQGGQSVTALEQMVGAANVAGAAAASNLTISQGLSQRLASQGVDFKTAQQQFQNLASQSGLYQQTVGEANKPAVPGALPTTQPLSESQQGVEAAFGLNANAEQEVEREALTRENEFRGGGGGTQTQEQGYSGIGSAKPY